MKPYIIIYDFKVTKDKQHRTKSITIHNNFHTTKLTLRMFNNFYYLKISHLKSEATIHAHILIFFKSLTLRITRISTKMNSTRYFLLVNNIPVIFTTQQKKLYFTCFSQNRVIQNK